jgi:O-acetyl-ADP-ribose deacetylase (regulator of RNase III)
MLQVRINGKLLELIQGDITGQETAAIVNAANSGLRGGGGVDGAIHRAGGPEIMAECLRLGGCPTGSACLTSAGRLKADYVIHAVGPVWRGGSSGEPDLLAGAYQRSLAIADEKKLRSISFPSLSTGAYRYPLDAAAAIALSTVIDHLRGETSLEKAVFVLFNRRSLDAYAHALADLEDGKRA